MKTFIYPLRVLYIVNYNNGQYQGALSFVNLTTKEQASTLTVGNGPWGIAQNPEGTKLYVSNSYDNTVSVNHYLGDDYKNIRKISVVVRNDDDDKYYATPVAASQDGQLQLGIGIVNATTITLWREAGGGFDANTFDSTSYNRGWVTIEYGF